MPKLTSVMLVDDDPTNNFLNERLLKRLDVTEQIVVAGNGQEALAELHRASTGPRPSYPALILLDIQMPIMNGIEFLRAFQQLPAALQHATTVVVLTTSLDVRDLSHLAELPATGRINKPLTPEKLDDALQMHYQRLRG